MDFEFETALAEIIESSDHPLITTAKFIFADDRPNGNAQAIPFEEFDNVAKSAIGMPVKINFRKVKKTNGSQGEATSHVGSYPIGHIRRMETITADDGSHQLIAYADLWSEEFPDIVGWLKDAYANGDAPGISWELKYREGILKDGIEWLKGVIASAATFVHAPAYGPRTALLALASIQNFEDHGDEVATMLLAIAEQLKTPIEDDKDKGGNRMTPEEEAKLRADAEKATTFAAEAASKQEEIERLLGEISTKDEEITALQDEVASMQKLALIESRVRTYTEQVGDLPAEAAEAETKKSVLASFSDDQFSAYIADLAAFKKAATPAVPAAASLRARASLEVPRVEVPSTTVGLDTLRAGLKGLARPNSVE